MGESLPTAPPTGGGPGGEYHDGEQSLPSPEGGRLFGDRPPPRGPPSVGGGTPTRVFREKLAEELELLIAEAKLKGVPREEFFSLCTAAFAGMEGVTMLLFIIFLFCDLLMVGVFFAVYGGKRPYAEGCSWASTCPRRPPTRRKWLR